MENMIAFNIMQIILDIAFIITLVIIVPDYLNDKITIRYLRSDIDLLYEYLPAESKYTSNDEINIKPVEVEEELPKINIGSVLELDKIKPKPNKKSKTKRRSYKDKYIIGDYIKSLQEMSDYVNGHNLVLYDNNSHKFLKLKYITDEWGDWVLHFENGYSSPFVTYVYKKCKRKDGLKEANYE